MRKTTNPFSLLHPGPSFTKQRLLWVLRHAAGRAGRWHQQLRRRRPEQFRPLTQGERNLQRLRHLADELAGLLAPFRLTRPRGHEPLRELLHDAESRPALVAQVRTLQAATDAMSLLSPEYERQVEGWRREWDCASPERRRYISEVEKGQPIAAMLRAFVMLTEEAKSDIAYITQMKPDAFTPLPTACPDNVSQSNQPAGPTPYS
jgi:hypothetical protein